jgi:hypothetical protein
MAIMRDKLYLTRIMMENKSKDIQKRLVSAISYFRLVNRLTKNKISEITGINYYLLANGTRPVSVFTIVRLEKVFGTPVASNLLLNAWSEKGDWTVLSLAKRISTEQVLWDKEKLALG